MKHISIPISMACSIVEAHFAIICDAIYEQHIKLAAFHFISLIHLGSLHN